MTTFNEANTVEQMVLDRMTKLGWAYVHGPTLQRSTSDVLLESVLAGALARLNPEIAAQPDRADEVIFKLRAVISGVGSGLVGANEEFMSWVRGEQSMPFGPDGEHVTINLVDFDDVELNTFIVANQVTINLGIEKRFDIVGYINGLPLVLGEAKSRSARRSAIIDARADGASIAEIAAALGLTRDAVYKAIRRTS